MTHQFRILTGSQAGRAFTPAHDTFVAGRHTDADLRFDVAHDLTVSAKHARFIRRGDRWFVHDLASLNGTFVNGKPVADETELRDGDRITFGAGGPVVELARGGAESTTQRLRAHVRQATRQTRWLAAALSVTLIAVVVAQLLVERRVHSGWTSERAQLQQRIDSLLMAGAPNPVPQHSEVAGLRAELEQSEQRLRQLRTRLGRTVSHGDEADALKQQLLSTSAALRRQQLAANLDYGTIQRRARGAVAMLWVEYTDGSRATGTAFAVRPDGLLITNKHVVAGTDGSRRVRRAAVRFADSDQAFPARIIAVSPEWDLAAAQVENVLGSVPSISMASGAAEVAAGAAVAMIGFPYGGEPAVDPLSSQVVARPIVSAGLVMRAADDGLEIQGLGAAGASGSPILDAGGSLAGILFGGRDDGGVHVLLAVPVHAAADFIASL